MRYLVLLFIFLITIQLSAQQIFTDQVYDDNIRSVQMNNVVPMGSSPVIEFDYLGGDGPYILVKIIHCNWNWEQSSLMENEFMSDFNEFRIDDVEGSSSAYVAYYHYRFKAPRVKLSGNYILKIFDEDNPKKIYMYRRFSVFEDRIVISGSRILSNVVRNRFTQQQIDFQFAYPSIEIQDPYMNLHAVVRQNNRWYNAKTDLKPSYINEADKVLKFSYFNGESSFSGGVEFRNVWFGRQTRNIDHFENTKEGIKYFIRQDVNRSDLNYTDHIDNNGYFEIDSPFDADYSKVRFSLKSGNVGNVYLFGQLSDWKLDNQFMMNFDSTSEEYSKTVLLKNGRYDYAYAIERSGKVDITTLQGSHSETRNSYDILIYYRPFGKIYDRIIGYKRIDN